MSKLVYLLDHSLETWVLLLIFSFELEISGVAVQKIHQNSENWWLLGGIASENDFETVLAIFCCFDYGANVSEAVQKIPSDTKDYHKCSSCVIILNSQNKSINNSEKRLVTKTLPK